MLRSRFRSRPVSAEPIRRQTHGNGGWTVEVDRGHDPDPPEGLRLPRDAVRVDAGGEHARRAPAEPGVLRVKATHAGETGPTKHVDKGGSWSVHARGGVVDKGALWSSVIGIRLSRGRKRDRGF